jgi:tetratricopeptide (TPR) repeat protein
LICIFLCAQCWSSKAQSADSLFLAGAFEKAAVKYEAQYFKAENIDESARALLQKARCYKQLQQFDKALLNLGRIPGYSISDSLAEELRYEILLCNYLSEDYHKAEFLVVQYKQEKISPKMQERMLLLEVLTKNQLYKYDEAKSAFVALMALKKLNVNTDSVYALVPKLKNPKKAEILSAIIPGSGQVYAGYPLEGITSLLLQTATLGFGAYKIYQGYYFIGFFTGFGLFQKFYFGGMNRAVFLTEKRNKDRNQQFNKQVYQLMTK